MRTKWVARRRVTPVIGPDFALDVTQNTKDDFIQLPSWVAANRTQTGAWFSRMAMVATSETTLGFEPTLPGEIPVHGARRVVNLLTRTSDWSSDVWAFPVAGTVTRPEPGVVRIVPTSPGSSQVWCQQMRLFDYSYSVQNVFLCASVEIRSVEDEGQKRITLDIGRDRTDGQGWTSWGGWVPVTREWRRVMVIGGGAYGWANDIRRLHWRITTWWDVTSDQIPKFGIEMRRPMLTFHPTEFYSYAQDYVDGDTDYGFGAPGVRYSATTTRYRWSSSTKLVTATDIPKRLTIIRGLRSTPAASTVDGNSCTPNLEQVDSGRLVNASFNASGVLHGALFGRELRAIGSGVHYVYAALSGTTNFHATAIVGMIDSNIRPGIYMNGSGWWCEAKVNAGWSGIAVTGQSGVTMRAAMFALGNNVYRIDAFVVTTPPGAGSTAQLRILNSAGNADYTASGEKFNVFAFYVYAGLWSGDLMWGRASQTRGNELYNMPTLRMGDQWIYGAEFWHDIVPPDGLTPSIGPNFSAIGSLAYMHQDGNVRLNYGTGGTKQRACATGLRRLFLHSLDAQIGSMLDQVASSPAYESGVLAPEGAPTLGARDTATYGPPYVRRLGIWSRRRRTSTMLAEIARQWSLA